MPHNINDPDLALFILDLARLAEFRSLSMDDAKRNDARYRKLVHWWLDLDSDYKENLCKEATAAAHIEALEGV